MTRIPILPTLVTLGNAFCGFMAIGCVLKAHMFWSQAEMVDSGSARVLLTQAANSLSWAGWCILFAMVFDALDGKVARLANATSDFGTQLDSLCDVISFGVAPAVIGFTLGLRGGWDMLVLTYFVVCGVSRLARFNVTASALADSATGKVKYFEGTPIPTSVAIVALLAVAFAQGAIDDRIWLGAVRFWGANFHPLSLVYGVSGSAMISATLRIPKP